MQHDARPRARAASWKLHTAGSSEPHCDACHTGGSVVGATLDARDHPHRHLGDVIGEVVRRADHLARRVDVGGVLRRQVAEHRVTVAVDRLERVAVPLGDRPLLLRVRDDEEVPALVVATRRCLGGDVDALADHREIDGRSRSSRLRTDRVVERSWSGSRGSSVDMAADANPQAAGAPPATAPLRARSGRTSPGRGTGTSPPTGRRSRRGWRSSR